MGRPGYIGWRNRLLGIDSLSPLKFKNTASAFATHIEESKRNRREAEIAVAKLIVPYWGNIVDSGIGLLHRPAGPNRQPYARVDYISPVMNFEFSLWTESSNRILDHPCRGFDVDLIWDPHFYK